MSYVEEDRRCTGCGKPEEDAHLDRCLVCGKWFCPDCSYRQTGRYFCSAACGRDFFWGESDETEHEADDVDDTLEE